MNEVVTINSTEDQARKEAWLAERRTCITGTDVACILGLSKFGGPMSVWFDKKGTLERQDNAAMMAGRLFERPILEAYSEINQVPIAFADHWTLHKVPGFDLLGASLDARWTSGDLRPVDAKNIRKRSADYGEDGSDVIPIYYQTQLAVQMMACETPYADLAVCFGGQDFVRFTTERDLDVEAAIKDKVESWWTKYIIGNEMPEADASDSCSDYIREKFRKAETGLVKEPTEELLEWINVRKEAAEAEKEAEKAKTEAENKIKLFLGDAESVPGVLTWKNNKDSVKTDWEMVAKEFKNLPIFNDAVKTYTETKPGARVLRIK